MQLGFAPEALLTPNLSDLHLSCSVGEWACSPFEIKPGATGSELREASPWYIVSFSLAHVHGPFYSQLHMALAGHAPQIYLHRTSLLRASIIWPHKTQIGPCLLAINRRQRIRFAPWLQWWALFRMKQVSERNLAFFKTNAKFLSEMPVHPKRI